MSDPVQQTATYVYLPHSLTLLADPQAALELGQGDGLVSVQVAVVGEAAGALLGLGLLLQVPLQGLQLLLVDVLAAVVVQLGEVPVNHPLLQGVVGVRLHKPARNTAILG